MGIIKLKQTNEKVALTDELENNNAVKTVLSAENTWGEENDLPQEILYENKEKKTVNQNVFCFNDGTKRQFISCSPQNYLDKQTNTHKKIQTCLCKNPDVQCWELGSKLGSFWEVKSQV